MANIALNEAKCHIFSPKAVYFIQRKQQYFKFLIVFYTLGSVNKRHIFESLYGDLYLVDHVHRLWINGSCGFTIPRL